MLCVAVSGGADSVCLLRTLVAVRDSATDFPAFTLCAVHVDHRLRGEESEADAAFVKALCVESGIPLYVYQKDVADRAAKEGLGTEEAGRRARHEAFLDCVREHGATKIALAHQANDRAETFLFHAARGTSLAGLASIRPMQDLCIDPTITEEEEGAACRNTIRIIRPILFASRDVIEEVLGLLGQSWCTDRTNTDEMYTRNGIRQQILPRLKEINAQAVVHIAATADDLAAADDYLCEEAKAWIAERIPQPGSTEENSAFLPDAFCKEKPLLQGYILLALLEQVGGARRDLGRTQVRQLTELFDKPAGKQIDLPYGVHAAREDGGIRIAQRNPYALRVRRGSNVVK